MNPLLKKKIKTYFQYSERYVSKDQEDEVIMQSRKEKKFKSSIKFEKNK